MFGDAKGLSLEDLLLQGIDAVKRGNKEGARLILQQVLERDKRNERAWLWLAAAQEDDTERRRLLMTVLGINPNNTQARNLLGAMDNAVRRQERSSMRLGISLIVLALILIVVVAVLVIVLIP